MFIMPANFTWEQHKLLTDNVKTTSRNIGQIQIQSVDNLGYECD